VLAENNYFVSDPNYGWQGGGTDIGDRTDIGHWWDWFLGDDRDAITADLYRESGRSWEFYTRLATDSDASHAANARAFNDWLVNDWLTDYGHQNVAVFDFYNVLTSNGGSRQTSDAGQDSGNHHRWWNGAVQHAHTVNNDFSAYGSGDGSDSHPSSAGGQKATAELVPLLNVFYHRFRGE
jgi:hypothetical protein